MNKHTCSVTAVKSSDQVTDHVTLINQGCDCSVSGQTNEEGAQRR